MKNAYNVLVKNKESKQIEEKNIFIGQIDLHFKDIGDIGAEIIAYGLPKSTAITKLNLSKYSRFFISTEKFNISNSYYRLLYN